MNIRLADLKISHLVLVLLLAGCLTGAGFWLVGQVHITQHADRATKCDLSYNPTSIAGQLCNQGKIDP